MTVCDFLPVFSSSGAGWVRLWSSLYQSRWVSSARLRSRRKRCWLRRSWPHSRGEAPHGLTKRSQFTLLRCRQRLSLLPREDIITVAPQDGIAEVGETSQLSKEDAIIGKVPLATHCCICVAIFSKQGDLERISHHSLHRRKAQGSFFLSRAPTFTAWGAVRTPDWLSGSIWHQRKKDDYLSSFSFS